MTANHKASRQYNADYDTLFSKCQEALEDCDFVIEEIEPSAGRIKAKVKGGWKSAGERLEIQVGQNGIVQIHSESALSTTIFDFGKNKNNVEAFFQALDQMLETAPGAAPPSTRSSPANDLLQEYQKSLARLELNLARQKNILFQYHENLLTVKEQAAKYGIDVPIKLVNEIKDFQEKITESEQAIEVLEQQILETEQKISQLKSR